MPRPHANAPTSLTTNHALYTGWVLGLMMKAGLPVEPVIDTDGNYTNRVILDLPTLAPGTSVALLIPAPPDGWKFDPLA